MAQVPYTGVPEVAPRDQPTPFRSLDAPVAAFGGATAAATEKMGGTLQTVGNELFTRAYAMQELDQQAKANEAISKFQNQQLQSFIDFQNRMGKDAYDHYPEFQSQMDALREQIRGSSGLSPYAQKLYDSESRNSAWRMRFSAGFHAAGELKKYNEASNGAIIDTAKAEAAAIPEDDTAFKAAMARTEAAIRASGKDQPPEAIEFAVNQARSALWGQRIEGLAKNKPWTARKVLDANKGEMTAAEAGRLEDIVKKQEYNKGSREEASRSFNGQDLSWLDTKPSMDRVMHAIKGYESGGNHTAVGPTVPERGVPGQPGYHPAGNAYSLYGMMSYNLNGQVENWLRDAGYGNMTLEQFRHDRDAQDAVFKMKMGQYLEETGSIGKALVKWFGSGRSDGYHTIDQYRAFVAGDLAKTASGVELDDHARGVAKERDPNDPVLADYMSDAFAKMHRKEQIRLKEEEVNNLKVVAHAVNTVRPDGRLPVDADELGQDPKVAEAYGHLSEKDQDLVKKHLQVNLRNGGFESTPEKQAKFDFYKGLALKSDHTPEEMDYLLDYNVLADQQPRPVQERMLALQEKVRKGMLGDAQKQMTRAMGILKQSGKLSDAGIDPSTDDGKMFMGALHDIIEEHIQTVGKPPKDEEIKAMGNRLIQNIGRQHWYNITSSYAYQEEVPDSATEQMIIRKYQDTHKGTTPSPEQIQTFYVATKYNMMFGPKPKSEAGRRPQ